MRQKKIVGIIGVGNMGIAIAEALLKNSWKIYAYDKNKPLKRKINFYIKKSAREVINQSPTLILAIKPQDIPEFINDNGETLRKASPLLISIAAGVSTRYFEKKLKNMRVIRVMPTLAAKKRLSLSFISKGKWGNQKDLKMACRIFNCVGESFIVSEKMLDKVTAISGSGPGYVFYFMDRLYESAVRLGFNSSMAKKIVWYIFWGALNIIKDESLYFKSWISRVASKGGTTQAAITFLEKNNFPQLLHSAILQAYNRAKELSLKD